ncbi:hypothetical protein GYA49_04275 [Candidatus Beckwithbacteria bacterium]|nr:hypothetical protein [Candidatus Beckwithbacteria bacterium]
MELPNITPRQHDILLLLYRFRFLNRLQLQNLLHHKDHKTINTWLKDLTQKNITGRIYSHKLKENTKPAIYYLATKSKHYLASQNQVNPKLLNRAYREKYRSQKFINHCLQLADFYLELLKTTEKNGILHFFTKTDLSTHYYLPYNRPDAYIARQNGKTIKRYFLEIIDEDTPRFMLRKKIGQYIDYYFSEKWQRKTHHPFPAILIICPNETMDDFLKKYIAQSLEEEPEADIDFYLSLKDKISWGNTLK